MEGSQEPFLCLLSTVSPATVVSGDGKCRSVTRSTFSLKLSKPLSGIFLQCEVRLNAII